MLMEDKTKGELVKQQHQIDKMRTDMDANMRILRAESETSYERLRADMAEYSSKIMEYIMEHSARQSQKIAEQSKEIAEQTEKIAEQSEKIAEQSEKMAEQNAKTAEQFSDVTKFVAAMAVGIVVVLGVLIKW